MLGVQTASVAAFGMLRAGWMDEFITYLKTDPAIDFHVLMQTQWLTDQHAPTFYILEWMWRVSFGIDQNIPAMRALSFTLSVIFCIVALLAWKRLFDDLPSFAFVLFTSPAVFYFSTEARSYIISIYAGVLLGIFVLAIRDVERRKGQWPVILFCGLAGALLSTVHAVSILTGGFVLAAVMVDRLLRGDVRATVAAFILAAGILAPTLVWTLFLLPGAQDALANFWITRWELLEAVAWAPVFAGPTVLLTALLSAGDFRAERKRESILAQGFWPVLVGLAFFAVAIALSVFRPFIVIRYLSLLVGFLLPASALLLGRLLRIHGMKVTLPLFGVAMACTAGCAAATPHSTGEWRKPGAFVADIAACQGAQIPVALLTTVPTQEAMSSWGVMFGWYAGDAGRFTPASPEVLQELRGQPCPVRLWIADFVERYVTDELRTAIASVCDAYPNAAVIAFRRGYLVISPPSEAATWHGVRSSCESLKQIRHRHSAES